MKFTAPKDQLANSAFRRAILEWATGNADRQEEIWIRCARDPIFYIDTFGWTFSPKEHPDAPNRPFILWDYQERALLQLNDALGHHDALIRKSRDMGASWVTLCLFEWRWHFRKRQSFLVGSRKEEYVDKSGDPKALFSKLDYFIGNLPGWLQPNFNRIKLHYENLDLNSTIDGESTNDDFARGDRRTGILLDEFAAVENGFQILSATRDATKCRIFSSTSQGTATAHYEMQTRMLQHAEDHVLTLGWWLHPEKRRGLYRSVESPTHRGHFTLQRIDLDYEFPDDYQFILDGKLRSPWYDQECLRAATKQEIAQELDMEDQASGWQFFDAKVLAGIIRDTARRPLYEGELMYGEFGKKPQWLEQSGGRLRLWCHIDEKGRVPAGQYVVGADVATGKGGEMSSNSVASIINRVTGEKIGQLTTNTMSPEDFADYCLSVCRWCNGAFFIWEENGPGGQVTAQVKKSDYRNIFYREDEESFGGKRKKSRKAGWQSTKDGKKVLLGQYALALIEKKFVNPCEEALKECGEYVHHPDGRIEHSRSSVKLDPTAAGENHGDMVIADAVAWRGCDDVPKEAATVEIEIPNASFLGRRMEAQRQRKQKAYW